MSEKLHLVIKRKYFDEILSGDKKIETREVKPTTIKRYFKLDEQGEFIDVIRYESLVLYAGYNSGRPCLEVEVMDYTVEFLDDEDGNPLTYTHNDEEHDCTNIIYSLGKVIDTKNIRTRFDRLAESTAVFDLVKSTTVGTEGIA